jgi:hypothetical protein
MLTSASLKFVQKIAGPKKPAGWYDEEHFALEKDVGPKVIRCDDNGIWRSTAWETVQDAVDAAMLMGFVLTKSTSDAADAFRYSAPGIDFETGGIDFGQIADYRGKFLREKTDCKHKPIQYTSFNMVYTICKKCDKTLA